MNLNFLGWFEKRETGFDAAGKIYHNREDTAIKERERIAAIGANIPTNQRSTDQGTGGGG